MIVTELLTSNQFDRKCTPKAANTALAPDHSTVELRNLDAQRRRPNDPSIRISHSSEVAKLRLKKNDAINHVFVFRSMFRVFLLST